MITRFGICLFFVSIFWGKTTHASRFLVDSTGTEIKGGKSFVLHKVEPGQTLYAVMRKYKTTIQALKEANPNMKDNLSVGQVVRVPSSTRTTTASKTPAKEPEKKPENNKLVIEYEAPSKTNPVVVKIEEEKPKIEPVKTVEEPKETTTNTPEKEEKPIISPAQNGIYRVEAGQSLYGVAIKNGVLMVDIRRWNGLASDQLRSGQDLIVSEQAYKEYLKKNKIDSVKLADTKKPYSEKIPPRGEDPTNGNLPEPKIANAGKRILETGVAEVLEGTDINNKYLALHRTAPVGSLIQVKNVSNSQSVWVKVIGKLPDISVNNRIIIKLSARAQEKLSPGGRQFVAELSYLSQ